MPRAGSHGGDGVRVAEFLGVDPASILDLSASLNPLAADPLPLFRRHLNALGHYPDVRAATDSLAEAMDVPAHRVLLTNGGSEAIALVAAELGGRAEEPEFSLHPRDAGNDVPRWRSNPHNPTGWLAPGDERADVWDEAFYPLATGCWTRGDAGAVVVGSLTKLFACPGLRIGYVLADADLVVALQRRQPEWAVNSLAVTVLPELLATADLPAWSLGIAQLRQELIELLECHGLDPQPSHANFVLCRRAPGLRERLLPQGILVRDCRSFGLAGQARLAVPTGTGLERLAKALDRVSADGGLV